MKDATDGSTVRTGYDQTDRPNEAEQRDGEGSLKYRTLIEYDKKNRVKAFNEAKYSLQGTTQGNGLTGGLPPVRFSM